MVCSPSVVREAHLANQFSGNLSRREVMLVRAAVSIDDEVLRPHAHAYLVTRVTKYLEVSVIQLHPE